MASLLFLVYLLSSGLTGGSKTWIARSSMPSTMIGGRAMTIYGKEFYATLLKALRSHVLFNSSALIGKCLMRLPVALNTAFATAGAIGGTPGSPTPPGGS